MDGPGMARLRNSILQGIVKDPITKNQVKLQKNSINVY